MSTRRLNIGIRSRAERESALRTAVKRIRQGDLTPQETGLYFESVEELRRILTDKRLDVLLAITRCHPGSVRALADLLGRNYKSVSADVDLLRQLGLVELEEQSGRRGVKVPVVPYDEIHVTITLRTASEVRAA